MGDHQCIKDVGTELLKEAKAFPDINLINLDPMYFGDIHIKQDPTKPVSIDLMVFDSKAYGIAGMRISKVEGMGADIRGPHSLTFKSKFTSLVGNYKINGKVLILPIRGSGQSNITLVEPTFYMTFTGEPVEKEGKTFMKPGNFKMQLIVKGMITYMENLFNDKALSDNMNSFLNENWEDIFGELKDSVVEAMKIPIRNVIIDVMEANPYSELFE